MRASPLFSDFTSDIGWTFSIDLPISVYYGYPVLVLRILKVIQYFGGLNSTVQIKLLNLVARGTATTGNDGAGAVDCDSRRAVRPTKTIRGVVWTQLNRLERLAVLSALREWSFYV